MIDVRCYADKTASGAAAAAMGAAAIAKAIAAKGHANVVLATGASQFEMLAALVQAPGVDWSRVTAFQRTVYEGALRCPPDGTWSYGELTTAIGQPMSASRAVGSALGQNPWPLLVPCHRFIGADGRLTGFSAPGGLATKLRLLQIEGAELALN